LKPSSLRSVIVAIAGWLAGLIVKGYGLGNIVVGIVGAGIAGFLAPRLGLCTVSLAYRSIFANSQRTYAGP
jgi:uncharacterized membrane protein YeaQ/YmgE (transglycosylase-associated protein family)